MKICFVSYEISPTTKGGAGALIANAIHFLLNNEQAKHEIILLLDIPVEEFIRFEWHDRLFFPNYQYIRSYRVEELCTDISYHPDSFSCFSLWKSYRFNHALKKLIQVEKSDIIEFFDYTGIAYIPLTEKLIDRYPKNIGHSIRYHTTMLPIHKTGLIAPDQNSLLVYGMEARSLELAERVVFPSNVIRDEVASSYNLSIRTECYISPPALKRKPSFEGTSENNKSILYFGYLDFSKGVDVFLSAALLLLAEEKDNNINFILVGGEFNQAPKGYASFKEYLQAQIPAVYSQHFTFTGHLSHQQLSMMLPQVRFAVFPSYIESFGYAAHELYALGVPLIVRDIPVFTEYFHHERNALVFDGSVEDLAHQMMLLWRDENLLRKLSKPYDVLPDPLGDCYQTPIQQHDLSGQHKFAQLSLKILVLSNQKLNVKSPHLEKCVIWQLLPEPDGKTPPFPFLGKLWWIYDETGNSIPVDEWRSDDLMLVITEHDTVDDTFLREAITILTKELGIGYVACWKEFNGNLKIFPTDAASETLIFEKDPIPTRIIFRTRANKHYFDLFDNRMGPFSEIGYIWKLEKEVGKGITIPEVFVRIKNPGAPFASLHLKSAEFNYLFMNSPLDKQAKIGHLFSITNSMVRNEQDDSSLRLAELDLKLLLKKLSTPPFGWIFKLRKNFRILLKRYLSK